MFTCFNRFDGERTVRGSDRADDDGVDVREGKEGIGVRVVSGCVNDGGALGMVQTLDSLDAAEIIVDPLLSSGGRVGNRDELRTGAETVDLDIRARQVGMRDEG